MAVAAPRTLSDRAEPIDAAAYFELLMNLTRREVRGRYSQSLFGFGWAVAQPLAIERSRPNGMFMIHAGNCVSLSYPRAPIAEQVGSG